MTVKNGICIVAKDLFIKKNDGNKKETTMLSLFYYSLLQKNMVKNEPAIIKMIDKTNNFGLAL